MFHKTSESVSKFVFLQFEYSTRNQMCVIFSRLPRQKCVLTMTHFFSNEQIQYQTRIIIRYDFF